eukprot:Protomagalhaensia_sp_Gyna_25__4851@NODE_503_length_3252_cov_467_803299_g394_i0_p1_GENE_NODE_503_length_3252_cov_467_803299_g394_i0NODE_503_length_3252_cov_467_803299_g394_i0_p1_ORF_typecomplete_len556_score106_96Cpn60_TCP1/PF00118_24/1_3e159_NODE_503_length_3252_cov_467_803299_g394_i015353202
MMMQNAPMMTQPIILLKEGTEASQGKNLILSNIRACQQIVETLKTTLGPRGQDKLMVSGNNVVSITNDGATIMDLLNIVHPAAAMLADISQSQDAEVGDGTTTVVILAGELMEEARSFIEDGVHPQLIVSGYRKACLLALEKVKELQVDLSSLNSEDKKATIEKCAETALNSKLLANHKQMFGSMVYQAVSRLDSVLDKSMIGILKVPGGSITDSFYLDGVAFKKTFSYAGFEAAPKYFSKPQILLLNLELELKAEKENAEVRIEKPEDYPKIIEAEWQIIYEKLEAIVSSGANVVLSRLAIGDLATQYFADRQVFCAGRVDEVDMKRTARACGAKILTTVTKLSSNDMGTCGAFEERQIGNDKYNVLSDCPKAGTATIVLRGGANQFIDEAERSLNDSIMTCCRALRSEAVVGGGGAVEMELSAYLREYSRRIPGKQQLIISAFAKALEVIPRTLASNAGLDATDVLNKLRQLHNRKTEDTRWFGVDCMGGEGVFDTVKHYVWEPVMIKTNALSAATEAACSVLSVDEMVKNPKSNPDPKNAQAVRGRGRTVRH